MMAQPGTGAWFTATAKLDREGRITFDFDDDNEPMVVQDDGRLVLYRGGVATWAH